MISDAVDDIAKRTQQRSEGLVFAVYGVLGKWAAGGGAFVAGAIITIVAFPARAVPGTVDPASRRGAFGHEYHGEMPHGRWLITKLDLLCARAVGFPNQSIAEDICFTVQVFPLLKREEFIDEFMYDYFYRTPHTRPQPAD